MDLVWEANILRENKEIRFYLMVIDKAVPSMEDLSIGENLVTKLTLSGFLG